MSTGLEALMRGKTVVTTGGTSGIGEVAAEKLAKMGARIVLVARDKTRGQATLARLCSSGPGVGHSIYLADLTRLAEMKRVAAQIADWRALRPAPAYPGRARIHIRAEPHGLFRPDRGVARTALSLETRAHHQHGFRRASGRHLGLRRSSIGEELPGLESL